MNGIPTGASRGVGAQPREAPALIARGTSDAMNGVPTGNDYRRRGDALIARGTSDAMNAVPGLGLNAAAALFLFLGLPAPSH